MTSSDNQQYITVELFNARMEKLEAIIERNLAITRADIAELKTFVEKNNAELKAEIADVRSEVRIQSTRIDNLVLWNHWFISLFVAFFLMPSVIECVRSAFKALSNGISALFKRK